MVWGGWSSHLSMQLSLPERWIRSTKKYEGKLIKVYKLKIAANFTSDRFQQVQLMLWPSGGLRNWSKIDWNLGPGLYLIRNHWRAQHSQFVLFIHGRSDFLTSFRFVVLVIGWLLDGIKFDSVGFAFADILGQGASEWGHAHYTNSMEWVPWMDVFLKIS